MSVMKPKLMELELKFNNLVLKQRLATTNFYQVTLIQDNALQLQLQLLKIVLLTLKILVTLICPHYLPPNAVVARMDIKETKMIAQSPPAQTKKITVSVMLPERIKPVMLVQFAKNVDQALPSH